MNRSLKASNDRSAGSGAILTFITPCWFRLTFARPASYRLGMPRLLRMGERLAAMHTLALMEGSNRHGELREEHSAGRAGRGGAPLPTTHVTIRPGRPELLPAAIGFTKNGSSSLTTPKCVAQQHVYCLSAPERAAAARHWAAEADSA